MRLPTRLQDQQGKRALVDGIPFNLPVQSEHSPALIAVFPINYQRAAAIFPGSELHPLKFFGKALLVVAVIDYRKTPIGAYIEYSLGVACTFGPKPVSLPWALLRRRHYGLGQYVIDLPVSSEVSVKGGKGIWGMPKHQANLDFEITERQVRSRYDKDGLMVTEVQIERPAKTNLKVGASAANWCTFRGMLMKSSIFFRGRGGFCLLSKATARLTLGDSPKADILRQLEIAPKALFTAYFSETSGTLDDHIESWFLTGEQAPVVATEGFDSVIDLGLSETWLPPPGSVNTPATTSSEPSSQTNSTEIPSVSQTSERSAP